jgi:hypothetical protein
MLCRIKQFTSLLPDWKWILPVCAAYATCRNGTSERRASMRGDIASREKARMGARVRHWGVLSFLAFLILGADHRRAKPAIST